MAMAMIPHMKDWLDLRMLCFMNVSYFLGVDSPGDKLFGFLGA